jgi:hypothetical protein
MQSARKGSGTAGQARVERELLAETNGLNTTLELLIFSPASVHSTLPDRLSAVRSAPIVSLRTKAWSRFFNKH